jgi:hypothetical protein
VLLAAQLPGVGSQRLMSDMDAWGYSFRLGNTRAWFDSDSHDARAWLVDHGVIDTRNQLTGLLRIDQSR